MNVSLVAEFGVSQATCHIRELEAESCARANGGDRRKCSLDLQHGSSPAVSGYGEGASTCARLESRYGKSQEGATVC